MLMCMAFGNTFGLSCYSCSRAHNFDGETMFASSRSCYFSDKHTNVYLRSCASDTTTNKYYCRTQVRLYDGIPTYVNRGCVSTSSDEDQSTMEMPSSDKCISDISGSTWRTTTANCYFHCNSSGCNNISSGTLKPCNSDCGRNANRGYCDYISGRCICNNGLHKNNCTEQDLITNTRKCAQCTSELDSGCQNKTISSACPSGQNYCSAAHTTTYDFDGNVARSVFTKSCTSSLPRSECKMSTIYDDAGINSVGYVEYICYSICGEDDCNTKINMSNIKSAASSRASRLYCQRCRSAIHDCNRGNILCQTDATHCKSTVMYAVDEHDFSDPAAYQLLSVVRDCATSNVPTGCKREKMGKSNLTKVTCQEACQGNGCNTGWPARPKCHRCSSYYYDSMYCLVDVDHTLGNCLPNQEYCIIKQTTTTHPSGMTAFKITRSCSYNDIGNGCSSYVRNNVTIKTCNQTCTTDGCNSGYADAGEYAPGVVAVFLP